MSQISDTDILTVLYDGGCPLCMREIAHVKGLAERSGSALQFVDISSGSAGCAIYAGDREQLLARFHVELPNGSRLVGAQAFVAMWSRLPGWRWLARIARLPGMMPLFEMLYSKFLLFRPKLQQVARRLEAKRG